MPDVHGRDVMNRYQAPAGLSVRLGGQRESPTSRRNGCHHRGWSGRALHELASWTSGPEHVVLDARPTLGGGWQDRWDEFCVVTPNWSSSLPGFPYEGPGPEGFMPRDEIAARVARYAEVIAAPIELDSRVLRLSTRPDGGSHLETSGGPLDAAQVVVATGSFHRPRFRPWQPRCRSASSRSTPTTTARQRILSLKGGAHTTFRLGPESAETDSQGTSRPTARAPRPVSSAVSSCVASCHRA